MSKMVKVLEITSYPPPHAGWGVRVSYVRKKLEMNGHICQVLNIGKSRKAKSPDYLDVQGGIDYITKVFRHVWNGYIIHTHLNGDSLKGLLLAFLAEVVSMFNGRRCVLTFHAGPEQLFFPAHKSRLLAPFYHMVFSIPRFIICNNDAVKVNIATYRIPEKKIFPIPSFSKEYLDYKNVALPTELEDFIRKHQPILSSYIFLRPEFYVESMMEAMGRLAKSHSKMGLILIGADTQSEKIQQMVDRAGLQGRVFATGDLSHDEFMTVLSKVHIYIRTPQKDGVCSSVLEALSLKVPVIASENGSRPESVIMFKTDSVEDLTATVSMVWNHYISIKSRIRVPDVRDTVTEEADLILRIE